MLKLIHISEGWRMFKRAVSVRKHGIKQYSGNTEKICKKIIENCYDTSQERFMVSAGHFNTFYCRDFGWIVKSLISLGYKMKVRNTLSYALEKFKEHGRVRVAISKSGKVFDFPNYAVDSLPYLLYSLQCLGDKKLVLKYKDFLNSEIRYFFNSVVNPSSGLVRQDVYFSSMKDHAKRKSACYDNCMLYLMQKACIQLKLNNPLKEYNYSKLIVGNFWTGNYFLDDLSGRKYIAGDANVFPFWTGVIKDKNMLKKSIASIMKQKLDSPLPLKYTANHGLGKLRIFDRLAKNYEGSSIWMHMGPLYVEVVGKADKNLQKHYVERYKEMIKKYKNFPEVFNPDGGLFNMMFYYTDEGMSWCANYLTLLKKTGVKP